MRSIRVAFASVLALGLLALSAQAVTFTGTLSTEDVYGSLVGSPGTAWASDTSLSYVVSRDSDDDYWSYAYTLTVPKKALSHLVLEVSSQENPFTYANLIDPNYAVGPDDIKWYGPGDSSNPGLDETLYGMKFNLGGPEDEGSPLTFDITFLSDRQPMWGDVYGKDGKDKGLDVFLYNAGIGPGAPFFAELVAYVDPLTLAPLAAFDGLSVGLSAATLHLLVPDTFSVGEPPPSVPEPLTVLGVLLGGAGLTRYLRRRAVA